MAKTFNPNRVGGGSVSIVRGADGSYSLKETGFDQISSLNMIDLGAIATTTTAATTETATDKTGTSVEDQTKQAFLLPKQDKGEDPFTTEKLLKSATDVSKGLSEVETVSDRQKTESQLGATEGPTVGSFGQDPTAQIKDPTGPVFGRTPLEDDFKTMVEPKVETPQEKLKLSAAEKEKRKPEFLSNLLDTLKGPKLKTDQTKFTKPSERAALGFPGDKSEVAQTGTTPPDAIVQGQPALGISRVPDSIKTGQPAIAPGVPDAIVQGQVAPPIATPAKRTFAQSVSTALKGVGEAVSKLPTMQFISSFGKQRNEDQATIGLNRKKFNVVTSSGSMQGRIVGDDGSYDPANNLFHGMNRDSAFGNLEKAGQKRIDRINKTLEKQKNRPGGPSQTLIDRKEKFEKELRDYKVEKAAEQKATQGPAGGATTDSGGGGGNTKIVCTMMNQSYGFGSFRNKIWMKFHKDLAPEYQKGYHRLFLPLVRIAKTNKIIKNILEHIAVHSTIDMRQSMRGKKHLLGRVYRKILLPICYWAGKK